MNNISVLTTDKQLERLITLQCKQNQLIEEMQPVAVVSIVDVDSINIKNVVSDNIIGITRHEEQIESAVSDLCSIMIHRPFSEETLINAIRSLLYLPTSPTQIKSPISLRMSSTHQAIFVGGKKVRLSPTEYAICDCLLNNRGSVVSTSQLYETIGEPQNSTNVINVMICRIRQKIERTCGMTVIHTVRNQGYTIKL